MACMAFRKLSREVDALAAGGMEFQIMMVAGKSENLIYIDPGANLPDVIGRGATRPVGGVVDKMVHRKFY